MKHIYIFVCLFLLNGVVSADNVIVGAFGQKLGMPINATDHPVDFFHTIEDERGAWVHNFIPTSIYHPFMTYQVHSTPVTKLIFMIRAFGSIDKKKCAIERDIIKTVLKDKYSKAYENVIGQKTMYGIGARFIDVGCKYLNSNDDEVEYFSATDSILSIDYVDIPLHNAVVDEKASQVDKSNF